MSRAICWLCRKSGDYCTNGLCRECHLECCTEGGATSPGHNLKPAAAQEQRYQESKKN